MRIYRDVTSMYKDWLLTTGYTLDTWQGRDGKYHVATQRLGGIECRTWSDISLANALYNLCLDLQIVPTFRCFVCKEPGALLNVDTVIRHLPNGDSYPICRTCAF